jgi:hypothetical protein
MKHPYNDTEHFEKIAEVYLGGYSWGIACVFRDKTTGRLYGDTDSGCSCYGPFDEGYGSLEDGFEGLGKLIDITHEREAAALLDNVRGEDEPEPSTEQRQDFVRAVRAALT